MIVPYPLTNQKYARKFREAAIHDWTLLELADLRGVKVFQNATVTNCIPFMQRIPHCADSVWISRADGDGAISRLFHQPIVRLVIDDKKAVWNTDAEDRSTARHADLPTLGDICYISKGMVINAHEKIAKGEFTKDDLISETKDRIHCREYIEAKDFVRYSIISIHYLEYGTARCPERISRPTFPELYEHPRILVNGFGAMQAVLDETRNILHNHTIYAVVPWHELSGVENKSIQGSVRKYARKGRTEMEKLSKKFDLRFLLAILNSRYGLVLLNRVRGGDFHILPEHLRAIPIPSASSADQSAIGSLVTRILSAKGNDSFCDISALESEIDELVCDLYGLTPEERAIVTGGGI